MESTANLSAFLKHTKLLGEVSSDVIEKYIIPAGHICHYEKNNQLISPGQEVATIQIILSGKVNIVYYYADGSYTLASSEIPSHVLNLDLIATKSKISPYFAMAAEKTSIFAFPTHLVLDAGTLPETERQKILSQLLIMLSHLHMQKEKHLMILSRNGLRDRVMTYLSLMTQWQKADSITIPFSREEMAAYLCVNRSTLSHELSKMKKEGIIDFHKNRFTLLQKIASPWGDRSS